jgi:hypothetical protein
VSRKKGTRKKRKKSQPVEQSGTAIPARIRETFERGARLFEELQEGVTIEEAIELRRHELRELLTRFDAVHFLGQLVFSEVPFNPETNKESEHRGVAYVVELAAAELLTRPSRAGASNVTPAIDANVLEPVRRLCHEAAPLESIRRTRTAGGFASAESAARARAASHHLMLRGPGWPWQEHETLRGLFGPDQFSTRLKRSLGFDVEDAIACSEAVARLAPKRLDEHMTAARESAAGFDANHPAHQWATATLTGWQDAGPAELRALAITGVWALNHLGDALLLDEESLAAAAAVDPAAARAFLSALSLPVGQPEGDWFQMAESVRQDPFIEFPGSGFLATVVGNDLWALRGIFETVLKGDDAYRMHRSRWLEERAADLVRRALDPDHVHLSVEYSYEDGEGRRIHGEIDGLVVSGDVAILVEAKGATMRPGARRGGEAFIKHVRDNLTKAAQQGTQARQALSEPGLVTQNGKPLDLPPVREVHPIVVTLDDLSAVAPVLWEFQGTRVMPEGVTIPWVVTLHELDLVASTIEWPVQLVHFLRRRSRLNQLGQFIASDELDWWMHYLLVGLYFEDEPLTGPIRLMSHTDPLDAWILHDRGRRRTLPRSRRCGLTRPAVRFST